MTEQELADARERLTESAMKSDKTFRKLVLSNQFQMMDMLKKIEGKKCACDPIL